MSSGELSRKPDGGTYIGLTSAHPGGIDVPLLATCDGDRCKLRHLCAGGPILYRVTVTEMSAYIPLAVKGLGTRLREPW